MLCRKIIITNDKRDNAQMLIDFIKERNVFFEVNNGGDACAVNIDSDDEKLYEICCGISEYIMYSEIKPDIKRILEHEYSCFNRDEKEIICRSVFLSDELSELAGRIYIYLKCNKAINPSGFYRFMCRDYAEMVSELVSEESDKLISFNDTADFIQLLKYFASMSPICAERVDIVAYSNGIRIVNVVNAGADHRAEFADMDITNDVLSELVNLNPAKIVIHGKDYYLKNDLCTVISGVFGGRIAFCDGCPMCKAQYD